ncbi:hypothetical protein C8Q77DRAFT_1035297, partial [Trametes polyzona]
AISCRPPFCQGTVNLPADDLALYYGRGTNASHIDLGHASPEELQHLAEVCDPATFGLGHQDVYDETYRKAGKLDASDFMIRFSPEAAGILDIVRSELLVEGRGKDAQNVRAELYKLNVYGPQAFFKAHVDTPRSELMFGSLVIVFPTAHEGGTLMLRTHDQDKTQEWAFDSSAMIAQAAQPSVAYVAFYSDVEHEVLPVLTGHRVTVTYNLYYVENTVGDAAAPTMPRPIAPNEASFRETLQRLLDDPVFLPTGGNLMIPLRHEYPLATASENTNESRKALQDVAHRLKATDAVVLRVLRELSLDASLKIVYQD